MNNAQRCRNSQPAKSSQPSSAFNNYQGDPRKELIATFGEFFDLVTERILPYGPITGWVAARGNRKEEGDRMKGEYCGEVVECGS